MILEQDSKFVLIKDEVAIGFVNTLCRTIG